MARIDSVPLECVCGNRVELPLRFAQHEVLCPSCDAVMQRVARPADVSARRERPAASAPGSGKRRVWLWVVGAVVFFGFCRAALPNDPYEPLTLRDREPTARFSTAPPAPSSSPAAPPQGAANPLLEADDWCSRLAGLIGAPPSSGHELVPAASYRTGHGELTIENGSNSDAIVALFPAAGPGRVLRAIYVRRGERGQMLELTAGTYVIKAKFGNDWVPTRSAFCRPSRAMAFDEPVSFTETPTIDGVLYDRWEISLHSVSGGNAETKPVPDFELVP